jgi:hypothetical protein
MQWGSGDFGRLTRQFDSAYGQAAHNANARGPSSLSRGKSKPIRFSRGGWLRAACIALTVQTASCRKPVPKQNPAPVAVPVATPGALTTIPSTNGPDIAQGNLAALRRLFALSEPGEAFISDNVVSNETSLLQPATALAKLRGGAYIGVGPEQNYTYIALSRPELAFIIDLRRDNALLHLMYKALFEAASSRLEFICLLLGRPYDPKLEPAPDAHAAALLAAAQGVAPMRVWFDQQQARLIERIQSHGLSLSEADIARIKHMHELFFDRQLDLRFELHEANGRKYPSFKRLLSLRTPSGVGTFLDSRESFQYVQQLHRQHRIVPLVGDVSAPRPLGAIADELRQRKLELSTFYISNVEQYLIGRPSLRGWLDNLRQLPHDQRTILLRCYLDQGRPHPRQESGQRSVSIAHGLTSFLYSSAIRHNRSYFEIMTDATLVANPSRLPDGSPNP